ncbi:uncharacterized protein TRIADDRAFT_55664 [Trichoplax adhaerens]|uniref:Rhodanese domain-containing protein n=1 Tax=Trichoplax adhaerens TaxID=10228 RepID=B3RVI4_TRIAD|nr:hypothetical protein TRIADDRAFT_55664 [Trichoplax adhaerens]EDV25506.1 hypothetical protein TRIADDRAFT_55664 [Trichoplax adhaerens]|eukprot:XP_002111539.1 hypothetical protein TRIADDRAFT_55664 [Trichoplax adhaerens]
MASMFVVQGGIQLRFPSVKHITTEQLYSWLQTQSHSNMNVMLLDIREEKEYDISHIVDAKRAELEITDFQQIHKEIEASNNENYAVVAYCSVGYRSSAFVDKLQRYISNTQDEKKYNIYNLEGSIFKWANEGRKMVNKFNDFTIYVHPYNLIWVYLYAYNTAHLLLSI